MSNVESPFIQEAFVITVHKFSTQAGLEYKLHNSSYVSIRGGAAT